MDQIPEVSDFHGKEFIVETGDWRLLKLKDHCFFDGLDLAEFVVKVTMRRLTVKFEHLSRVETVALCGR